MFFKHGQCWFYDIIIAINNNYTVINSTMMMQIISVIFITDLKKESHAPLKNQFKIKQ